MESYTYYLTCSEKHQIVGDILLSMLQSWKKDTPQSGSKAPYTWGVP